MSGLPASTFSNTSTGSKPADPYKQHNKTDDEHISLKQKVEDLVEFVEGLKYGMLTTHQTDTGMLVSRCMAIAAKENGVDLLFHTNTETGKTDEIKSDQHVNVAFIKPSTGDWASISGTATIETDREKVKKYYSQQLKTWVGDLGDGIHDGSANDPRIGIIKVSMVTATYSLAKGTAVSRGIEMAKGAVTGKAASVTRLRELHPDEVMQYRNLCSSSS
ncbi:protein bli-3 [Ascodesmis nigricans]|uniref:Protein bli-3 n=1 Tax=Ascodesmis nigricans TaxID=341454 RepID=A0A4S2MS10_9PEZI|nr:protein bli-3 [Ascodesmis nigricans]